MDLKALVELLYGRLTSTATQMADATHRLQSEVGSLTIRTLEGQKRYLTSEIKSLTERERVAAAGGAAETPAALEAIRRDRCAKEELLEQVEAGIVHLKNLEQLKVRCVCKRRHERLCG